MSRRIDLLGQKFGKWSVVSYSHTNEKGIASWLCKCDCGTVATVNGTNLRHGTTRSCGCLQKEVTKNRNKTHGMSKTRAYKIWAGMIQRCTNPSRDAYKHYGARNIDVSKEWLSFENFYQDMKDPPSEGYSLERINNDAGYSASNCVWATKQDQSRNNRNCKLTIEMASSIKKSMQSGMTIASAAREFCISESLARFIKQGKVWKDC